MISTLNQTGFQGNVIIKRSGRIDDTGIEAGRKFFKLHVPKAQEHFETLIPDIEKSRKDLVIDHFSQSGIGGALSECIVSVVAPKSMKAEKPLAQASLDDYGASASVFGARTGFNFGKLFRVQWPFEPKPSPIWKKIKKALNA